jgi:hypothetical protein
MDGKMSEGDVYCFLVLPPQASLSTNFRIMDFSKYKHNNLYFSVDYVDSLTVNVMNRFYTKDFAHAIGFPPVKHLMTKSRSLKLN